MVETALDILRASGMEGNLMRIAPSVGKNRVSITRDDSVEQTRRMADIPIRLTGPSDDSVAIDVSSTHHHPDVIQYPKNNRTLIWR